MVTREPVGVTAGITPSNSPSAMVTRKSAPALAVGCTMVLKPEQTPLSALAIAALADEAGVPPGVLSVVTGYGRDAPDIGVELTSSPFVRKLSFTGSTELGKLLLKQCADQVKKLSLELGGNAPFIVFDDADLDVAVADDWLELEYRALGGSRRPCRGLMWVTGRCAWAPARGASRPARSSPIPAGIGAQ